MTRDEKVKMLDRVRKGLKLTFDENSLERASQYAAIMSALIADLD